MQTQNTKTFFKNKKRSQFDKVASFAKVCCHKWNASKLYKLVYYEPFLRQRKLKHPGTYYFTGNYALWGDEWQNGLYNLVKIPKSIMELEDHVHIPKRAEIEEVHRNNIYKFRIDWENTPYQQVPHNQSNNEELHKIALSFNDKTLMQHDNKGGADYY